MSFWDIIWFIIISYLFIAYLMLLFNVIRDIFRDQEMSGIAKAVWLVALLFLPLLTLLVYLIARGSGMAKRDYQARQHAQSAQDDYIKSVAGSDELADGRDREGQVAAGLRCHQPGRVRRDQAEGPGLDTRALGTQCMSALSAISARPSRPAEAAAIA